MITTIKLQGYSISPSDYDSLDGELAYSRGIISEQGEIRPMSGYSVIGDTGGYNVLTKHHTSYGEDYYIAKDGETLLAVNVSTGLAQTLMESPEVDRVELVGNTICAMCRDGIHYILANKISYKYLGKLPELPDLRFALDIDRAESGYLYYDASKLPEADATEEMVKEEELNELKKAKEDYHNKLLGAANKLLDKYKDKFCFPFFVRYAFRLSDETLTKHSAPILMLPSTFVNPVVRRNGASMADLVGVSNCSVVLAFAELGMELNRPADIAYDAWKEDWEKWKDLIKGVDVFVSEPIYTYNQAATSEEYRVLNNIVNADTDWPGGSPSFGRFKGSPDDKYYARRVPFNELFMHKLSGDVNFFALPQKENWIEQLKSTSRFYHYASYSLEELLQSVSQSILHHTFKVKSDVEDIREIATRELMTDELNTHCEISSANSFVYNSRLHLSNITRKLTNGLPLLNNIPICGTSEIDAATRVKILKGGKEYWVGLDSQKYYSEIAENFCYFYFPDRDAVELRIEMGKSTGEGFLPQVVSVQLKPHDFLNGAYYFNEFKLLNTPSRENPVALSPDTSLLQAGDLMVSDVNNPFCFSPENTTRVGTGAVLALRPAVTALSQGQFGQFPLYAFTTEGVWALDVATDGTYSSKRPITRDVCVHPEAIEQIDDAIIFTTDRGVMMLAGTNSICISDILDGVAPSWHGIETAPFREYVKEAQYIYVYSKQRIIVFNPYFSYQYVFSLESKQWSIMMGDILKKIKTFPEAMAVNGKGKIISWGDDTDSLTDATLITRPLKLGAPGVYKSLREVLVRSNINPDKPCVVKIYASNDLNRWELIAARVGWFIRGLAGTGYKFFKVEIITTLSKRDHISAIDIRYEPKRNNKLR